MAEYSWGFSAPASPIKITKGTNTYTYTGLAIPMGGYSYTVTDFDENDEVTISAAGYNKVSVNVGEVTIIMTEMPEVEVLNPNGTNYAIADAKARQQVADLETIIYNDLQNYVTKDTQQTITGAKTFELSPIIPSPGANDNTTKAATTAWIRTFVKNSGANYMTTISKATNGYCRFTNGLLIQWGQTSSYTARNPTITLNQSYTSATSYVVVGSGTYGNTSSNGWSYTTSRTTTNFKAVVDTDMKPWIWIAIGY